MREAILASVRSRPMTTFQHLTVDVPDFRGPLGMFTPERDSSFGTPAPARRSLRSTYKHMSKKLIISLLFGGIMLTTIPFAFAQANPMQQFEGQTIDEMIGSFMKEHHIPGMTWRSCRLPISRASWATVPPISKTGSWRRPRPGGMSAKSRMGSQPWPSCSCLRPENSPSTIPLASMSNICRRRGGPSRSGSSSAIVPDAGLHPAAVIRFDARLQA